MRNTQITAMATIGLITVLYIAPGCERRDGERMEDPTTASSPANPVQHGAGSPSNDESVVQPGAIPQGWRYDPQPRPMRMATYIVPDASGDIEVAVTRFPARVGGELANINRWRTQMGLEPVTEEQLDSVLTRYTLEGGDGYQTRIDSPTGVMLAAGIYEAAEDRTWFVRATAPSPQAADRVEEAVFGFARSVIKSDIGADAPSAQDTGGAGGG
jgi:hypothetical protein